MKCYKLTLTPIIQTDEEETKELLWDYLGILFKNGQLYDDYLLIKSGGDYLAFVTLPGDDALDERYNNVYMAETLAKVKEIFKISSELVGENLDPDEPCRCEEKPEWYMLYSDFANHESPVFCGRCGKSVPLYKLPHIFGEDEHHQVISWNRSYREVDSLFMQCLSDRFTYRQLNDVNSQLSKTGREICSEFEKATGVPFYYYVYHYVGLSGKRKTPETCPVCGGEWKLNGEKTFIDYKCDRCRLVADEV